MTARGRASSIWIDRLVLVAGMGVLVSGFGAVVRGRDWWFTTMIVVAGVCLVGAVLRQLGARIVLPVTLVSWAIAVCWVFVPGTLWMGVVPTPSTARALGQLVERARTIIIEEQAPVDGGVPVVLVIASLLGIVAVLSEALLAERHGVVVVGVLWLSVFCTPALIVGSTPPAWLFALAAAAWLYLMWARRAAERDWRRSAPAAGLAAVALGVASTGPTVSPDISAVASAWGEPPPAVFGTGINPMLNLGQNLRRHAPVRALTYSTTMTSPPYLKVATLREFDGETWRPSRTRPGDALEGSVGIDSDVPTTVETTDITIANLRSSMLPVPYPVTDVDGLEGRWRVERLGLTVRAEEGNTRGQQYTASSILALPSAERMRAARTLTGWQATPDLELPADVPQVVLDTAREVTAGASTAYDKARALQEFFRSGDFSYSETAPVAEGYDGNGVEVLEEFLEKKAGYCVHFASAMAVMARASGLPARIAVGYAPGRSIGRVDGEQRYAVTSDDLHAWPEIHFVGIGWVGFEPTPGVGRATRFTEPAAGAGGEETPDEEEPERSFTRPEEESVVAADETPEATGGTTGRAAGLAGLVVLAVVVVPALWRRWRRYRRERRGDAHHLWLELTDLARDLGAHTDPYETPRATAGVIGVLPGADEAALHELLEAVEIARFGPPGRGADPEARRHYRAVARSLRSGARPARRGRALVWPPTLLDPSR